MTAELKTNAGRKPTVALKPNTDLNLKEQLKKSKVKIIEDLDVVSKVIFYISSQFYF